MAWMQPWAPSCSGRQLQAGKAGEAEASFQRRAVCIPARAWIAPTAPVPPLLLSQPPLTHTGVSHLSPLKYLSKSGSDQKKHI